MKIPLSSAGRTALWIGGGGFVGLAIGALATNPGRAVELSPLWLIGLAIYVGLVVGLTRDRAGAAAHEPIRPKQAKAAAVSRATSSQQPVAADALALRFDFPDVPAGYPPVLGHGEPLEVKVKVLHLGKPSEGAGVQLLAEIGGENLTGDGVTGTHGEVSFTLEPEGLGELTLRAEATAGKHSGRGTSAVSVVEYEREIERLFGEFRAYAVGVLGPEAHADTARELCDKLRVRASPQTARALLELARAYELVAYGERRADRRLYLAVLEQLMVLEQAELEAGPDAVSREA